MKYALTAIVVLFAALILSARIGMARRDDGPAYTAQQVQAGILWHANRWLGRTVLVRGVVTGEGVLYAPGAAVRSYAIGERAGMVAVAWSMPATPVDLAQGVAPDPEAPLIVRQGFGGDGWFGALVRRLPLLDRLLPARRAVGRYAATYRVALNDASAAPGCAASVCYSAELLDPAPTL